MMDIEKGAIPSEEKEVEELARAMCPYSKGSLCRECSEACFYKDYAKRAIDKGWRKQSEGKWEKVMNHRACSKCGYNAPYKKIKAGYHLQDLSNFCPNCGAKMKGGAG